MVRITLREEDKGDGLIIGELIMDLDCMGGMSGFKAVIKVH